MPSPTKCEVDSKLSIYSSDNLNILEKEFRNLYSEVINGKKPFKECEKRIVKEKDQVAKDTNDNGYKADLSQYDKANLNFRYNFFNRTLSPILIDPTLVNADIPSGDNTFKPLEKKVIVQKSKWKKENVAKEYFDSLLDKYEKERREMMNNSEKESSYKKYSSRDDDDEKEFKMSEKEQYESFNKIMGESDDLPEDSELSYIWNEFNRSIKNNDDSSSDVTPNTPILSSEGLEALEKFILTVDPIIYKRKNKSFKFTHAFLDKFKSALIDFFKEKKELLKELNDDKDDDTNDNDGDDDGDDDTSDSENPKKKFKQIQSGYARVAKFSISKLIDNMRSDARSMKKISEENQNEEKIEEEKEEEQQEKGIFGKIKGLITTSKALGTMAKEMRQDPEQNGLLSCALKILKELNAEQSRILDFQKNKKLSDSNQESSSDESTDPDESKDIYKFISTLKSKNDPELGKKFISSRAKLLFIKDCLDIRFDKDENNKDVKSADLKRVEDDLRKKVYDYLPNFDLHKESLNIDGAKGIIELLKNKKKMKKVVKEIEKIVSQNFEPDKTEFNIFQRENKIFDSEKKTFDDISDLKKIPDSIDKADAKVKLYISLDDHHKSVFEDKLKKVKVKANEDMLLKYIYDHGENGKNYLKYHAIASYLEKFVSCYDIKFEGGKDKEEQQKNAQKDAKLQKINESISKINEEKIDPKNIYDILSNPNASDKWDKILNKYTETYMGIYNILDPGYKNDEIFVESQQKQIEKKIGDLNKFIDDYKINDVYAKVKKDDLKPYIISDEALMTKEVTKMKEDHKKEVEKKKLDENTKLYDDLQGEDEIVEKKKEFLLERAKVGYLYIFLNTKLYDDEFYQTTLKEQREIDSKINKITDVRNKIINYDVSQLSKMTNDDFNNVNKILDDWKKLDVDNIYNKMQKMKKNNHEDQEGFELLYNEYNSISKENIDNIDRNNNLKKIILLDSQDWDSKLKEQQEKLKKYKERKEFTNEKENFEKNISKRKIEDIYTKLNSILTNTNNDNTDKNTKLTSEESKTVNDYLLNRIKLNLIRIYAETNLFGLQKDDDKNKYSAKHTQLSNNIKGLNLWDNNLRDIVDILENKNKKDEVTEKDKNGNDVKKEVINKECKSKFDNLKNKYKTINSSANNINAQVTKIGWTEGEDNTKNGICALFKNNKKVIKYTKQNNEKLLNEYYLGDKLDQLLSENKDLKGNELKINNIVQRRKLEYNCMSFNESDFKKELEEAEQIKKKNTI